MTNIYQNTADQIIMLEDLNDEEDKSKRRERPPMYSTLPRSGESKKHNMKESREPTLTGTAKQKRSEKKRLRRIFRSVSIN